MDPILQILLNWQFVTFGLAISAIIFVVRKVLEYLMETFTNLEKENKLWNDLILPILPVFLGALGGWLITGFPYPTGVSDVGSRVIWGLGAGLLSGLMYRVFKALLIQKIQAVFPNAAATLSPPAPPAPVMIAPPQMSANLPPRGSL